MKLQTACFLVLLTISQQTLAQRFSLEPELGITSSMFPKSARWPGAREIILPVLSPSAGLWLAHTTRRTQLAWGVQFYQIGQYYSYERNRFNPLYYQNVSHVTTEQMTFRQLTFPLTAGYNFDIGKIPFTFFIGYRMSYFTHGLYSTKDEITYERDQNLNFYRERKFSPFSADLAVRAPTRTSQFIIGANNTYRGVWRFVISWSVRLKYVYFEEELPPNAIPDTGELFHQYSRSDLMLSVRYVLKGKQVVECDLVNRQH